MALSISPELLRIIFNLLCQRSTHQDVGRAADIQTRHMTSTQCRIIVSDIYVSTPLKLAHSDVDVRLLIIQPSTNWYAPLECDLEVVSLDDRPRYRTLSYCWGKDNSKVTVYNGGRHFPISLSLNDALRHVRYIKVSRIWVDQIASIEVNTELNTVSLLKHFYCVELYFLGSIAMFRIL
jgi:Heterokaryon incompatibility protein (HET)